MDKIVELINIERWVDCCKLNLTTGEKNFCGCLEKSDGFSGWYFDDYGVFFAIYPAEHGPMMYYEGKEYVLHKGLHISLRIDGKEREFTIEEYNIKIKYLESPYIGFDAWSNEEDVDLFYQIAQFYQDDEYYKKYIKK